MAKPKPSKKTAAAPKPASGKGEVLARRALSTVVLWAVIAAAIAFKSAILLHALIIIVGTLACAEFLGLLGLRGTPGWGAVSKVTVICAAGHLIGVSLGLRLFPSAAFLGFFDWLALPLLVIGVTSALLFHPIDPERTRDMFFGSVFGFVYTALLSSFLMRLVDAGQWDAFATEKQISGAYYVLFLLVVTKFADMGAYIVGTAIGKNKFIPHISPGKTWEGILLGAFPFALLGGCVVYHFFGDLMTLLSWTHVIVLCVLLAAVAIVGDLAESILKRCLAKKDSGAALPGIGGVLDLIDSVLFTAPVLFFYLMSLAA